MKKERRELEPRENHTLSFMVGGDGSSLLAFLVMASGRPKIGVPALAQFLGGKVPIV